MLEAGTRGAEMMGTCALTFRVCSTACGSASETLDPCMPERGEIRETGFRNSSAQKKQPGVQDPHHLHLQETWVNCSSTQSPGSPHFMRKHA